MNDPHVEALLYRVSHAATFSYEKAKLLEDRLPEFHIKIERLQATVVPTDHFATAEEARAMVEPLLCAWELDAALRHDHPDVLRFAYLEPKIIDRNPAPGVLHAQRFSNTTSFGQPTLQQVLREYPAPPVGLIVRPGDVAAAMFDRWSHYVRHHKNRLGDAAHVCLTLLEDSTKEEEGKKENKRRAAARKYTIEFKVLDRIGKLAATKGGILHGRKGKAVYGEAVDMDYTDREIAWLEAKLKQLIRRVAEVAHDPGAARPWITMDDLPGL
jgi:hypothetical protein